MRIVASVSSIEIRSANAPDVAARVAEETQENMHISDGFAAQEAQDEKTESQVKANKDLKSMAQMSIVDPCESITCGALKCPVGFKVEEVAGHCCPYCVNPDIDISTAPTGASGSTGGVASTFCPKVWCFPTMCDKPEQNPNQASGECCARCPA